MHANILEDPDAELEKGLKAEDHETAAYVLHALVKHLEAGGVVPKRLRGEGTAVGKMLYDEQVNLGHFRFKASTANTHEEESAYLGNAEATADAIRAVTGEG